MERGERQPDGTYPAGSVNCLVDARLRQMGDALRRFARRRRKAGAQGEGEEQQQGQA